MPSAIRAAAQAGFDAVECHWPYGEDLSAIREALLETGLCMLGLNTPRGSEGEFGLSALPGRNGEARGAIEQAVEWAAQLEARHVHVMAGLAQGHVAQATYIENLEFACQSARSAGLLVVIEPINSHDVAGYFLSGFDQAAEVIDAVGYENLKLMVDCYHAGRMGLSVFDVLRQHIGQTGHIQFASVPDRGPPDHGDVDYRAVFDFLDGAGWNVPLGAEYLPPGETQDSLGWLMAEGRGIEVLPSPDGRAW